VYLIGAGASAGVLPTTASMPKHLFDTVNLVGKELSEWRQKNPDEKLIDGHLGFSRDYAFDQLRTDLLWLLNELGKHASVDTIAKKAFLTKNNWLLKRVKASLTAFFFLKQILNAPDPRYDTFFASILDTSLQIPQNIKVVSWNYDFQFEKAFASYIGSTNLSEIELKLGVVPKFGTKQRTNQSIFKINGITDIINQVGKVKLFGSVDPPVDMQYFYSDFANSYYNYVHKEENQMALSFAWEDDHIIELAKKEAFDRSSVLVVVGYSFPFFNRDVDRKLLKDMQVRKLYIQDQYPVQTWDRIRSIRTDLKDEIVDLIEVRPGELGQFHLPSEI
jgi:hypothetical protein